MRSLLATGVVVGTALILSAAATLDSGSPALARQQQAPTAGVCQVRQSTEVCDFLGNPTAVGTPTTPLCPPGEEMNTECLDGCWSTRQQDVAAAISAACEKAIQANRTWTQRTIAINQAYDACIHSVPPSMRLRCDTARATEEKRACEKNNQKIQCAVDEMNAAVATADAAYATCAMSCCEAPD